LRYLKCVLSVACIAFLASCGGASGVSPAFGSGTAPAAPTPAKAITGTAKLLIHIPRRRHRHNFLHPKYLSPATQSIAITITSVQTGRSTAFNRNLTPSSPGCNAATMTCTITMRLNIGSYNAAFATFDGLLDPGGNPTGKELSSNQNVAFTYRQGRDNVISVTLEGVPATVTMYPSASSSLSGSSSTGYSLARCAAVPQVVNVYGQDADGNLILGPGAPVVTLTSNKPSALAASPPSQTSPNRFVLTPPSAPNYAPPGTVVHLSASAQPGAASGAGAQSSSINVTYGSGICGVLTEYQIPTPMSSPQGLAVGPDGAIWFTETAANRIGRIPTTATAANPQITEYPVTTSNSHPYGISASNDALWFTECVGNNIGRISTDGKVVLEFPIPTAVAAPQSITAGPDGAQWFTESLGNNIGRIPTSGPISVTEFPVPTASSLPYQITTGSDGALWFVESLGNNIGRIPTSATPLSPQISEYPVLTPHSFLRDITLGSDGALWFVESQGNKVGRIPVGGSPVSEFADQENGQPKGVVSGPDGAIWFVEKLGNSIGRVLTTGTSFTYYPIPTPNAVIGDPRIIVGPDGSLWFTEVSAGKIGRLQ
jgi:virginiamycin B lyase